MPPALILSLILGSLYGLIFYLIVSGGQRGMGYYWLVGAVGFLAGQFLSEYASLSSFTLGDVHIIEGSLVCWLALFMLYKKG